jgi:hypothetical protein
MLNMGRKKAFGDIVNHERYFRGTTLAHAIMIPDRKIGATKILLSPDMSYGK